MLHGNGMQFCTDLHLKWTCCNYFWFDSSGFELTKTKPLVDLNDCSFHVLVEALKTFLLCQKDAIAILNINFLRSDHGHFNADVWARGTHYVWFAPEILDSMVMVAILHRSLFKIHVSRMVILLSMPSNAMLPYISNNLVICCCVSSTRGPWCWIGVEVK